MAGRNGRLILISVAGLAALFLVTLVAAQSTSTATVEVRVWRNVEDPERLHLSTRPADGRWVTHDTRLDMSERSDSGLWHQSSIVAVDVEVPATGVGPEPSQLSGIDGSQVCADVVAFVAEHFAESTSVFSCMGSEYGAGLAARGIVVHRGQNAALFGTWSETDGLTGLTWNSMHSSPQTSEPCFRVLVWLFENYGFGKLTACQSNAYINLGEESASLVWLITGTALEPDTGIEWGFKAWLGETASEPNPWYLFRLPGNTYTPHVSIEPSRFAGIDDTPECAAVVAFVAEHFAETTSITSCEGQPKGAGSLRGTLMHRDEPGYFDGAWSETDGITRLNWTAIATYPYPATQCTVILNWLAEHTGLTVGACDIAEVSVQFHEGGPALLWVVVGTLRDSTGERQFRAWVVDGVTTPYAFKVHTPAETESPPAE